MLNQLSKKDLLDILNRKLVGGATPEEKTMLYILSKAKMGENPIARYDPTSKTINVLLLNSEDFEKYNGALMHEFTHKALNDLLPEIKRQEADIISHGGETKEKLTEKEKIQNLFFKSLTAIDESFAHQVSRYYGVDDDPDYDGYGDKIPRKVFEKIYSSIEKATANKSLEEFDQMTFHIYKLFASKWKEDLSMEDLKKAGRDTIEEINKFITK